ncbi:hypothetical protein [Sphingosinithalassobacter portus]|uniref:hypothetical protein n=1 Tax=Stakelama portus TaxID=2676234 RepID=UPI0011AB3ED4|nr:hypothetical protein [Sphingosinithalassobacter portus]
MTGFTQVLCAFVEPWSSVVRIARDPNLQGIYKFGSVGWIDENVIARYLKRLIYPSNNALCRLSGPLRNLSQHRLKGCSRFVASDEWWTMNIDAAHDASRFA